MIYLNYTNLDPETQERLLSMSKEAIKKECGKDLEAYAIENELDYDALLEEEALRHLDTYQYVFNIQVKINGHSATP